MGLITPAKLLADHGSEQDPGVFLIWRQANFREQMKRAVMLVRAAVWKEIFQEGSTLLIIGGGVSGVAAGLEAAKHGVLVTLLESEKTLFPVQQNCPTRYLHPHEYYWPLVHCGEPSFPFLEKDKLICPQQMHWKAGVASKVAEKLAKQIETGRPSNLDLNLGVRRIPVSLETLRNKFDREGDFEFILICSGADERAHLEEKHAPAGNFASFKYWQKDPFEDLSSIGRGKEIKRILISGGGDGGLQDFLRIIHHQQKGELFSAGKLLGRILPVLKQSPEFVEWVEKKQRDCRSYRPDPVLMWDELSELFDLISKNAKCWKSISRAVLKTIDPSVESGERTVELIFRETTFSDAFALNAFLVHLVNRVMDLRTLLRPNCELEQIVSASKRHRCSRRAARCCGKPHEVFFKANGGLLG